MDTTKLYFHPLTHFIHEQNMVAEQERNSQKSNHFIQNKVATLQLRQKELHCACFPVNILRNYFSSFFKEMLLKDFSARLFYQKKGQRSIRTFAKKLYRRWVLNTPSKENIQYQKTHMQVSFYSDIAGICPVAVLKRNSTKVIFQRIFPIFFYLTACIKCLESKIILIFMIPLIREIITVSVELCKDNCRSSRQHFWCFQKRKFI